MNLVRKSQDFKTICAVIRRYSLSRKNHYDVLNLRRNCSDKDIKEAFIQMSKEYHPDKNKDARAQEKFVRIVEAYTILGKPGSRAKYDNRMEIPTTSGAPSYVYRTRTPYNLRKNPCYNSYYYQTEPNSNFTKEKTTDENTNSYYGVPGVKKLPNYYFVCMCFGFAFFGVMVQIIVIRNMYAIQRAKAHERSRLLAEELSRVRNAAKDNGNEAQTRLLLDKIVSASNVTVTTASLGQALACDKKDLSETLLADLGVNEVTDVWYDALPDDEVNIKVNLYDLVRKFMSYIS